MMNLRYTVEHSGLTEDEQHGPDGRRHTTAVGSIAFRTFTDGLDDFGQPLEGGMPSSPTTSEGGESWAMTSIGHDTVAGYESLS